jgi:UDP-N-acetylglucosamine acyltransferase
MNKIHPTCIIDENVELGEGNEILPYTIIKGPTKIGNNNIIGPFVVIGSPGEDTKNPRYDSTKSKIEIGNNNIIREHVAIQKPCINDITKIGSNVFLMHSVHVPHDAILHDNVVVTPLVVIGGITNLLKGANIGISSSIHQNTVVGHYSMVGMGSTLTKNVKPFTIYVRDRKPKVNIYALKKFNLMNYEEEITEYVINDIYPKDEFLLSIIEEFEILHQKSNRKIYS